MEFKSRTGATIRILDVPPKTPQEQARHNAAVYKTCCEVLANAVAAIGVEATRELMTNGPHAYLLEGK